MLNDLQRMMTIMDPGLTALTRRVDAMVTEISTLKAEVTRLKQAAPAKRAAPAA